MVVLFFGVVVAIITCYRTKTIADICSKAAVTIRVGVGVGGVTIVAYVCVVF